VADLDLVRVREQLIFGKYAPPPLDPTAASYRGRVGMNRSFLVHTYYPLYAHFFNQLGYASVLPTTADQEGSISAMRLSATLPNWRMDFFMP
jgi:predicted nucleotide-binding protein (sugar kinase/HSP70/actin superfamily)